MQLQFQRSRAQSSVNSVSILVSFSAGSLCPQTLTVTQEATRVQRQPPHPLKGPHTAHSVQRQGSASWGKRLSD